MNTTIGPWRVWAHPGGLFDVMEDQPKLQMVAACGENEKRACLIAAAPELLEALELLLDRIDHITGPDARDVFCKAISAIAKATGQPQ